MKAVLALILFFSATAFAAKEYYPLSEGGQIFIGNAADGMLQVEVISPLTNNQWKLCARATYVDTNPLRVKGQNSYVLPVDLENGKSGVLLVLTTGHVAFLPLKKPRAQVHNLHFSYREWNGDHFIITSLHTEAEQGLFLTRFRDALTYTLDNKFHNIHDGAEAAFPIVLKDGTLWFPGSGSYFPLSRMGAVEYMMKTGTFLKSATGFQLMQFEKEALGKTGFHFIPGNDFSVIFHPLWLRLGPGLMGGAPGGNLRSHIENLAFLVRTATSPHSDFELEAAMASLRLLTGRDLTLKEFAEYVAEEIRVFEQLRDGTFPRQPEGPDTWVSRTILWKNVQELPHRAAKFELLVTYLTHENPEVVRTAQAAMRFWLGGEIGIYRAIGRDSSLALEDSHYVEAAKIKREQAQNAITQVNLRKWLEERHAPRSPEWWNALAFLARRSPSPEITRAANELIESYAGGKEKLPHPDPGRAAQILSGLPAQHFLTGFSCREILAMENAPPSIN